MASEACIKAREQICASIMSNNLEIGTGQTLLDEFDKLALQFGPEIAQALIQLIINRKTQFKFGFPDLAGIKLFVAMLLEQQRGAILDAADTALSQAFDLVVAALKS